jgi:hypothetical protein
MMENNTAEVLGEVGTPTDLWRAGKGFSPMTPEDAHELMGDEERQELRDRVLRLRLWRRATR